jgi:hypothetical protein
MAIFLLEAITGDGCWMGEQMGGDEDNNQVEVVSTQLVHIFHAWQHVFQVKCRVLRHHISQLMVITAQTLSDGWNTAATAEADFHLKVT